MSSDPFARFKRYEYQPESFRLLLSSVLSGIEANEQYSWLDADAKARRALEDAEALVDVVLEKMDAVEAAKPEGGS